MSRSMHLICMRRSIHRCSCKMLSLTERHLVASWNRRIWREIASHVNIRLLISATGPLSCQCDKFEPIRTFSWQSTQSTWNENRITLNEIKLVGSRMIRHENICFMPPNRFHAAKPPLFIICRMMRCQSIFCSCHFFNIFEYVPTVSLEDNLPKRLVQIIW